MARDYNPAEDMLDYGAWVDASGGVGFSFVDYVHAQVLQGNITTDILGAVVGWLWPEFVDVDGSIILASQIYKFKGFKSQGLPVDEIEYWSNLTNIDGVLLGMPNTFSLHLATVIKDMWRSKLHNDFPDRKFVVEVVEVREQNELNVTFRGK